MKTLFLVFIVFALLGIAACSGSRSASDSSAEAFSVLVFSKTAGFRHTSIPAGIRAVETLGQANNFTVRSTEDAGVFTPDSLAAYQAIIFLNTNGDVLDASQQTAFEQYVQGGGGYVGVHSAAATEYDWPFYGEVVGAWFDEHPEPQEALVKVIDRTHPSTLHLPQRWMRFDEWYNYRSNPRGNVHVLAKLEEKSYEGGTMGYDHPIAWAHTNAGGRAWYTGLGHTEEVYADSLFLDHLLGGIRWAAGAVEADVGTTVAGNYEKVVLSGEVTNPMELDIAADGRVFLVERAGAVKMWDPRTQELMVVGYVPVNMVIEDGLLGLALDPDFMRTNWLYLYYAPEDGGANRLSRFTLVDHWVDLESEVILLTVPVQREICCHSGGSITFDHKGNLYLSTGDNTAAPDRLGSSTDERAGRKHYDAQRTSANTNDLRGKILRIKPLPSGIYEIPPGNLFQGDRLHRPEIYTMGHRNPFRIAVDEQTGWLYWGDVGYGNPPTDRGPWGWDEFNQARKAGFFGWPYFVGPNEAYRDYDHETETMRDYYDPQAPINDSPNNTGARELPPAQEAMIWYTYGMSEEFPEVGAGGINPMAGPILHHDAVRYSPKAMPPYYNRRHIIYEWMRNWVQVVTFDANGDLFDISPFLPGLEFVRPMDMEVGPEGALYILEWGDEFWGSNANAQLVRVDYHGSTHRPPTVQLAATPSSGSVPLSVSFATTETHAQDQEAVLTFAWDFDGDGKVDDQTANPTHVFETPGQYRTNLKVTDSRGKHTSKQIVVTAGNAVPEVTITWPKEGGFFAFDAPLSYEVAVVDADAAIDGSRVAVRPYSVFDTHALPLPFEERTGTEGIVQVTRAFTHVPDLYFVDRGAEIRVQYTDDGGEAGIPLEASARVRLQPFFKEAEHVVAQEGATRKTFGVHPAAKYYEASALTAMILRKDHWLAYAPINLLNIDSLTFRIKALKPGALEVRLDSPTGELLATVPLDSTLMVGTQEAAQLETLERASAHEPEDVTEGLDQAAYQGWSEVTVPLSDPGGEHPLYVVSRSVERGVVVQIDWMQFHGMGMLGDRPGTSP